jgi:hypothetical protein
MSTYAALKGRAAPAAPAAQGKPAAELTPEQMAAVAENRAFVLEHMPEAVDFIKELHAAGLISGWRSVVQCRLLDASENE